eukprot:CAMPEP_0184389380 /NCGR_PEP_ID=MMETSP0007-20130409/12426_1 /TAXON_ID=97485 /ORGANISM="Prymnesium parvum, Strain Texoma1" /LENGTH=43 /DNA_ID= /DNA_START= /DNA_END= /DNA_ORIENTATION=
MDDGEILLMKPSMIGEAIGGAAAKNNGGTDSIKDRSGGGAGGE